MNRSQLRRIARILLVAIATTSLTACQWRGLNSLSLPGTAGHGPGSYTIEAQLPDVVNIEQNTRVRVGDVTVGNVTGIRLQDMHALVTMRIDGNVQLPTNSTAKVGQTSLLGSMHIELAPPTDAPALGRLGDGSLIPLSSSSNYPTTEQTLAAVSVLLNGGGVGKLHEINTAMVTALSGREADTRSLLTQLDTFIGQANDQTDDIIAATESLNSLVAQFAEKNDVVDAALNTIPNALADLNDQRRNLADAVDVLGRFSAVATSTVTESREALLANLRNVGPVLDALANAGPALTKALGVLTTFPWPKDTLSNWYRGDYANLTMVVDLTLSRIDSALFTGTRWEGDLTALEQQWGRTIGMQPSPYTAGNPLTVPYHDGGY